MVFFQIFNTPQKTWKKNESILLIIFGNHQKLYKGIQQKIKRKKKNKGKIEYHIVIKKKWKKKKEKKKEKKEKGLGVDGKAGTE